MKAELRLKNFLQGIRESLRNKRQLEYHSLWYSVVHAYSKCNLTEEGDELIALSGVDQRDGGTQQASGTKLYSMISLGILRMMRNDVKPLMLLLGPAEYLALGISRR